MDMCPCTKCYVLNKEFIIMFSEDHHARSGRLAAPSEYVALGEKAPLCCKKSVADYNIICALKIEVL